MKENVSSQVLIGAFSGLLVIYFFDPILGFMSKAFYTLASVLYKSYFDRLYTEIATGLVDYAFLCYTFIMFMFVAFLFTINRALERKINDKDDKASFSDRVHLKRRVVIGRISLFMLILCTCFVVSDGYIRQKIASTYNQHLRVIAPYVSDGELKMIVSKFASMRGEEDYLNVVALIENVYRENRLYIPDNKLYFF